MDQWQQFANNIAAANGTNTGDIYHDYAVAKAGIDQSPAAVVPKQEVAQAGIDAANQANAKAAADIKAKAAQDATDPSKAQMRLLPNNQGYAFYDGTGKQININQFSLLTGKPPDQLLANSPNPKDQKFVQDYKTLQTLSAAWVNGDKKTLDTMRAADPQKFNQIISTYKSPADMVKAFTQHWSDYYSPNTTSQSPKTPDFGPNPNLNAPNKAQIASLAPTSLDQVLTPQTLTKPSWSLGGTVLSHIPFTSENKAVNDYNAATRANPWFTYNNALYGQ